MSTGDCAWSNVGWHPRALTALRHNVASYLLDGILAGLSPTVGFAVKSLGKIIRSVQAFGRELSRKPALPPVVTRVPAISLALGGGFARGIAHIAALNVVEQTCMPIRVVTVTSVGDLIVACYV